MFIFFFFFNWHCNPCGFWPAHLSLSILSRKVFTECRCQRHIKAPNLEDQWLEHSNSHHQVSPRLKWRERTSAAEGELWARNCREFCRKWQLPCHFWVLLHAINYSMGPTAFLPLRRKTGWGYFRPKNPTALAGFEPANSGTRGQHAHL